MEAGSPRADTPSAPLESTPSSCSLRSAKRRHVSTSGSPSTSQGPNVTTISLEVSDTFDGHSNTVYSAVPLSRHVTFQDTHVVRQQHLVQQKSALFDCQPLPSSHLPPLFHSLLSFPTMLPRMHLLVPWGFLRSSPLDQGISYIVLQGQSLLFSSANCSTTRVFLSSVTFA
jgi:hypothetical protein